MVYSTLLKALYRTVYGEPPDLSEGDPGLGLVVVADGVGGFDLCGTALRYVLGAERLPYALKVVNWGHGFGRWHSDLTNEANRDAHGRKVADLVHEFRRQYPGVPAFLIGKSGGSGVIVKALEHLEEDTIDRVILLAPALAPGYDLTRALRAVRQEMVVFWSPLDVFILGAGTKVFGTIDRVKSVSAGLVGFRVPAEPSAEQAAGYAKLRQVRWRADMMPAGNLGGHVGPDAPAFLRKYVVPLLRAEGDPVGAIHPDEQSSPPGEASIT